MSLSEFNRYFPFVVDIARSTCNKYPGFIGLFELDNGVSPLACLCALPYWHDSHIGIGMLVI